MNSSRKKVLIISYYWPPSGGAGVQRWVKFCKYLPQFKIDPIVLTVNDGTYPLIDETLVDEVPKELEVYRSKAFEPYSIFGKLLGKDSQAVSTPSTAFNTENESWLKKIGVWIRANLFIPDARVGWIPSATSLAGKIIKEHQIDTIISTGPPNSTHLIGTSLKKKHPNIKWVMDMRDPWTEIFYNKSLPRTEIASKIDVFFEKRALGLADEVVVVSEGMSKLQFTIKNRNYSVIPNGFDHTDFLKATKTNPKFTIKYIGSMTSTAIPYSFFEALKKIPVDIRSKIEVNLIGSINSKVHEIIREHGLNDVISISDYIPHLEAKKEMQSADILLLVIPESEDNELIITGKLFDYIGSQTPILLIGPKNGDAANIIQKYRLGICYEYEDTKGLYDALKSILNGEEIEYQQWKKPLKEHPFSRFSLTAKLAEVLY